jgi:type VI secretion system protein ImpA
LSKPQDRKVEITTQLFGRCGEDISYDQGYLALEQLLQSRQTGGGLLGQEETSEEPNWREVYEKSCELMGRSKDLRVCTYLAISLLKLNGIPGLRDGLSLLSGILDRFWDHLYPQLDPDDGNDPLERINIMQSLSPPSVSDQDPIKLRQRLCGIPLCNSASMGRFSFRDIQVARGEISSSSDQDAKVPDMSVIEAAFQDTTTIELQEIFEALEGANGHVTEMLGVFSERASQAQTPNFSGLQALLANIQKIMQGYLAKRGLGEPLDESLGQVPNEQEGGGGVPLTGDIRSRSDALAAMEKVCQYFERHEPSSPIPLLLRRAQKLVDKNFLDVIRDVCPDAMGTVQAIGGVSDSDSGTDY